VERRGLRPFLKWVGGKRQLLPALRRCYPGSIGTYFEPFLGSGAVYFDLIRRGGIDQHRVRLTDANPDLIGCYRRLADATPAVIEELERLADGYAAAGRDHYLRVRDERFNPDRAAWRESGADVDRYPVSLAAMLIFLNRTGYNGLFRVNAGGQYNVPPGRYDRPRIVDRWLLEAVAAVLPHDSCGLRVAPYDWLIDTAVAGDFVYFDPPYAPVSATANFRGYTRRGFTDQDQERLQQVVITLSQRGVNVLLSNSTAPAVAALYEHNPEAFAAGLRAWRVPARRAVNSNIERRGAVEELVVSNVPPRDVPA
jgi:DNA adenine methylase